MIYTKYEHVYFSAIRPILSDRVTYLADKQISNLPECCEFSMTWLQTYNTFSQLPHLCGACSGLPQ